MTLAPLQVQLQRAQALHQTGRIGEAWMALAPLRQAIDRHGQALRLYAVVAQAAGQANAAIDALRQVAKLERDPPEIVGALADTLGTTGRYDEALPLWASLAARLPGNGDLHLNHAVTAANAGKHDLAIRAADAGLKHFPGHSRLLAVKAMALKNAGRTAESVAVFDKAVAADPNRPLTRHNQAVALRAAGRFDDACEAFAAAQRLGMAGAQFHANWAAAALEAGRVEEAARLYRQALTDDPAHEESLTGLTRLHVEYGTGTDPFDHYAALTRIQGDRPESWVAFANALALHRRYGEAADVAGQGLKRHPLDRILRVAGAFSEGMAGDASEPLARLRRWYEADPEDEFLWSTISQVGLRAGDPEIAAETAQRLTARHPLDQTSWSLLSLAWRLLDDPREEWLCDYDRLIMTAQVTPADGSMSAAGYARAVANMLDPLHTTLEAPADQSLRQGTQTRGALFENPSKDIQRFREAVSNAAAGAVANLPRDRGHPFLSRVSTQFRFSGSWSVRLRAGGGHHVPHFHSQGWMSSAYYARLPERDASQVVDQEGWIEFGRPPPIFNLDLPPRRLIEPKEGMLVLFPSYMWHGTTPFGAGDRLTAAFDYLPLTEPN